MSRVHWSLSAALVVGLAASANVLAQTAPDAPRAPSAVQIAPIEDPIEVEDRLTDQGYTRIVLVDEAPPYARAFACQGPSDYRLLLDGDATVTDRQRVGRCGGRESVEVRAPFTDVDVDRGDVHVRAPFADVQVDDRGVRVRAPFVDLDIPRRR